jgi:hypothetical protein
MTRCLFFLVLAGCALDWPPPLPAASGDGSACDRCPALALTSEPGTVRAVAAGDDLQAAIDAAKPGDELLLEPGATYAGIVLPDKAGTAPITIRTAALDAIAAPCTRIGAEVLPRIVGAGGPAIVTDRGHHWRLVGIELSVTGSSEAVVKLGSESESESAYLPRDIVLDRVRVRSDAEHGTLWGVWINGQDIRLLNSRVSDLYDPSDSTNLGSHAVLIDNTPGAIVVANNHLESSWAHVIVGAHGGALPDVVPSGIEIRWNDFTRPAAWWEARDNAYDLQSFIELLNATAVVVEGNAMERSKFRAAFELTPDRRNGDRLFAEVSDVTIAHNRVDAVERGFTLEPTDSEVGGPPFTGRVTVENNLVTGVAGAVIAFIGAPGQGFDGLTWRHNTTTQNNRFAAVANSGNVASVVDSVLYHGEYGIHCDGQGSGEACLDFGFASWELHHDMVVLGNHPPDGYPAANNVFVMDDPGFIDKAAGNYRLTTTSPGHGAASDGTDIGVDLDALEAASSCRSQRMP